MKNKNKNKTTSINNNESGSAILWILIAVGLFAALNFAFNSSSRTSTTFLTDSEAETYAKQIIQYGNEVKAAVKRMSLRGIDDTEFSFENTAFKFNNGSLVTPANHNPNCITNKCKVFHIEGGGIQPTIITQNATTTSSAPTSMQAGHWRAFEMSMDGIGTAENDIALAAAFVKLSTCLKINEILNINNPSNSPPVASGTSGTYNGLLTTTGNWPTAPELFGKSQQCYEVGSGTGNYVFLQVLIAR